MLTLLSPSGDNLIMGCTNVKDLKGDTAISGAGIEMVGGKYIISFDDLKYSTKNLIKILWVRKQSAWLSCVGGCLGGKSAFFNEV